MGHGWPPLLHSLRMGLRPSLSIDVVTTAPGDMFTEMRAACLPTAPGCMPRSTSRTSRYPRTC